MISLKYFSTLAIFVASQISAAPMKGEAGILLSKRSETFSGDGTYYNPGLGACGVTNNAEQLIAAMNAPQFGPYSHPSDSPACYSCAMVTGPLGSVKVKIVDKCPSCKFGSLDLSPAAFNHIALEAQGRVPITWTYVACDGASEHDDKSTPAKHTPAKAEDVKPAETHVKPAETHAKPAETHVKPTETHAKPAKTTVKPAKTTETPVPTTTHSVPASSTKSAAPSVTASHQTELLAADGTCNYDRVCVRSGITGEYKTCVNGQVISQSCASGTVCMNLLGDIICTWAD